jgi:drug/metabolite transporter (DMT)-like permease
LTALRDSAGTTRGMSALLLTVMMAWGLNIPAMKALTEAMDVLWVAALRIVLATLVLTLFLWLRDGRLPRVPRAQWPILGATAFLMIYLNQVLFCNGIGITTATNASLIMALIPSLSVVAGALVMRERVHPGAVIGIVLGFAGVSLVVLMAPRAHLGAAGLGELLLVAALISFVGGGLLIQRMARNLDVLVMSWATYVIASAMLGLHASVTGDWDQLRSAFALPWVWGSLLYCGLIGTALGNVAWYFAIGRIGQSRASPFLYWLPIFGISFSALVLGESLGWWHLLGLALVITGTRFARGGRLLPV